MTGDAAGSAYEKGLAALRAAQDAPPPQSRGVIALREESCTSCMLCAKECPDWCIEIDSHKEVLPPVTERGRPRTVHVLDRFAIDYGLCMWCGICVEVCPFEALFWAPELPPVATAPGQLVHERADLRQWLAGVPDLGTPEPSASLD